MFNIFYCELYVNIKDTKIRTTIKIAARITNSVEKSRTTLFTNIPVNFCKINPDRYHPQDCKNPKPNRSEKRTEKLYWNGRHNVSHSKPTSLQFLFFISLVSNPPTHFTSADSKQKYPHPQLDPLMIAPLGRGWSATRTLRESTPQELKRMDEFDDKIERPLVTHSWN